MNIKVDVPLPREINQLVDKAIKKDLTKYKNKCSRLEEQIISLKADKRSAEDYARQLERKLDFFNRLKDYFKEMLEDSND